MSLSKGPISEGPIFEGPISEGPILLLRSYYKLYMYISSEDEKLTKQFRDLVEAHNEEVSECLASGSHCSAGFHLLMPTQYNNVKPQVMCSMTFYTPGASEFWVGYYLYPRTERQTRRFHSAFHTAVGIIDSGNRGNLIPQEMIPPASDGVETEYESLFQICPPNLTHPMTVTLVENVLDLDKAVSGKK
jgi:hypothetical protein|tara:strand:- start:22 stop:588 length:567 start_codon:yes stop_codon:yes gene_type:complete